MEGNISFAQSVTVSGYSKRGGFAQETLFGADIMPVIIHGYRKILMQPETMPVEGFSFKLDTHHRIFVVRSSCEGKYIMILECDDGTYSDIGQGEYLNKDQIREHLEALKAWEKKDGS